MRFPSEYPRQARSIARQVESELNEADRKSLREDAARLGLAGWRVELAAVREDACELLEHPPSAWRARLSRLDPYQRRLRLCSMLLCAQEGSVFLEMLSIRAPLLAAGGSFRQTLQHAVMFLTVP